FRLYFVFFFSSRRRHTISKRDWSSDVCSSDLKFEDGKITPLDPAPEITTDTLRDTHRIVAMMGPEPFQEAVTNGADVVLAGRAKIGRASCRERMELGVGGGACERNKEQKQERIL